LLNAAQNPLPVLVHFDLKTPIVPRSRLQESMLGFRIEIRPT
jgi:hypothetical protein